MEKKTISVGLTEEAYNQLEEMAKKAGISLESLSSLLLQSFTENGGKVFTGKWREGPGLRILPDWPRFSSGVIKIKETDLLQ